MTFELVRVPTASLDFGNQGKVMREIRRLAGDGLAVLFTTHDPNQAARFADRALLIGKGSVQAIGPAAEVVRRNVCRRCTGRRSRRSRTRRGAAGPSCQVDDSGEPGWSAGEFVLSVTKSSYQGRSRDVPVSPVPVAIG